MNHRHILHVFRKDGLEILRDRRTLFVNVVLPALLYPFIALFMIQVLQITRAQHVAPPLVAAIDLDDHLRRLLATAQADEHGGTRFTAGPPTAPPAAGATPTRPALGLADLPAAQATAVRRLAQELDAYARAVDRHALAPGAKTSQHHARQQLLALLREREITAAVVRLPAPADDATHLVVVTDTARLHSDLAAQVINDVLDTYRHELVIARLARVGLAASALKPLAVERLSLAPIAEAVRMRLAGIIPLLLVIMAAIGAFYPALDLIAGERERGTLESLLSWPVERRDIFIGKLLVTCAAAALSVILNLGSLAVTVALAGKQLAAAGADLEGALSAGLGTLALSFLVLVPLTVTLGALSLVLAGLAASAKEAQNYLTPLLLVVMVAAVVAAIPDTRANLALDLVPITGSVLALKTSLQAQTLPWFDLAVSTIASLALAAVVVSWASRLLDSERFCYPGLIRAGWGRFRRWGAPPSAPNGLEVMAVYAVAVGGMTFAGGFFQQLPAPLFVAGPLVLFILGPALLHGWLGAYPPGALLPLSRPRADDLRRAVIALPFAILTSVAISVLQPQPPPDLDHGTTDVLAALHAHGLLIELLCAAVVPGICEEVLCRGTLLTGLRSSLGNNAGVVLSAFLFATLHLSPFRFLPQFTLGIALALITLRSGSLIPAMLLHAGHNALALILSDHQEWFTHLPGARLVMATPPLAALGVGLLGLWLAICAHAGHFGRFGRRDGLT